MTRDHSANYFMPMKSKQTPANSMSKQKGDDSAFGVAAGSAITSEATEAIRRLKTVSFRLRQTQMGEAWTRREYDADIIDLEVIPALQRVLVHSKPNK